MTPNPCRSPRRLLAALALPLALVACGGGGGSEDPTPPAASCSLADQKAWLTSYMDDWYFWYRLSPRPDPAPYTSVGSYFDALLYTGTSATFPADRWSDFQSTESFDRFFGDGATLGYGVAVSGVEANGDPTRPLWVRYVEPGSPAAAPAAGVRRGDQVLAINGTLVSTVIASDDYSALTAGQTGDRLTLRLRRAGVDRTVELTAAVFNLAPVQAAAVQTTAGGRKLGYLQVKDMISQALPGMETAFAQFKAAGVQDVVLDLRYNGGGLVSTGGTLASYVAGARGNDKAYASLLYNDKRAATHNQRFAFSTLVSSLGLPRVYVLSGPRTCSASEQVINGLRGAGVVVVTVGDTSCGKPVGFLPSSSCGQTYSVVNFESVNQLNEGRYFDGFDAVCPAAEDFTAAQGSLADPLLAAAQRLADGGSCLQPGADGRAQPLALRRSGPRKVEAGERQGMIPR
ncbi:MAG: S41 family peptidase [Rubrivivax sp.]|nr:S41 family peptidase [Rubrivivax sp.]